MTAITTSKRRHNNSNNCQWLLVPFLGLALAWSILSTSIGIIRLLTDSINAAGQAHRTTTVTTPTTTSNSDPCQHVLGILRIRSGDEGAAAGTMFFNYVVNHLLYADMTNLLPWVFLDNTTHRVFDSEVHNDEKTHFTLQMRREQILIGRKEIPLQPVPLSREQLQNESAIETFQFTGNGVWDSYFEPVSGFDPLHNRTCPSSNTPLYEIDYAAVILGMHEGAAVWAVQAWPYAPMLREHQLHQRLPEWYLPMRRRAASVVRRYIRPKPWLVQAVDQVNPLEPSQECMAMHVRTTDKELSGLRREIPLSKYLPHAESFLQETDYTGTIYLATDSSKTLETIQNEWPRTISQRIRTQQTALWSDSSRPIFDLTSHHRANTEVLIDIYAMSKCSMLIHGWSAVSEAVYYINPNIRGVDLEDDNRTIREIQSKVGD